MYDGGGHHRVSDIPTFSIPSPILAHQNPLTLYLFHQGYSVPQKIVFQFVVWANSSHILLIWGHFLLNLINDLVKGWLAWTHTHWASKLINWLARQENLFVLDYLTGLLLNPAYETQLNPVLKWFLLLSNADHINSRFHKYIIISFLAFLQCIWVQEWRASQKMPITPGQRFIQNSGRK